LDENIGQMRLTTPLIKTEAISHKINQEFNDLTSATPLRLGVVNRANAMRTFKFT